MSSNVINPIKVEGLGELVDCEDKDFLNHLTDKDLGYCLSLKNLFNMSYEQIDKIKGDLMCLKQTEEVVAHIEALIVNMAKLEHKAYILRDEIVKRGLKV